MKKNKKAFTLIEIIIATWILSIAVFWVYKLIWENSKLINNSDNYLQLNNLFLNLEECIKSKKNDIKIKNNWDIVKINFWNDLKWCNISTTDNKVEINNIDYFLNAEINDKQNNYIDLELSIEWDWIWKEKKDFRLSLN